jgi:multiple sugar transport system ATP-binding protein
MNVRANLSFGLKIRKVPKAQIRARVEETARILGIEDLMNRKPKELSGGQRQRVAIGRAIVRDPKVFLLDEPLSNLDAGLRVQMRAELKLLFGKLGATCIYVTHDQAEAMTMSDEIAILRQGKLQQVGSPLEIYYEPVNRFVAGFVGNPPMNFVSCIAKQDGSLIRLRASDFELSMPRDRLSVPEDQLPSDVILGIRPEDLDFEAPVGDQEIPGACMVVERTGSATILLVETGEEAFTLQMPGAVRIKAGDNVRMRFDASRVYLFAKDDGRALVTPRYEAVGEEGNWQENSTIRSR